MLAATLPLAELPLVGHRWCGVEGFARDKSKYCSEVLDCASKTREKNVGCRTALASSIFQSGLDQGLAKALRTMSSIPYCAATMVTYLNQLLGALELEVICLLASFLRLCTVALHCFR